VGEARGGGGGVVQALDVLQAVVHPHSWWALCSATTSTRRGTGGCDRERQLPRLARPVLVNGGHPLSTQSHTFTSCASSVAVTAGPRRCCMMRNASTVGSTSVSLDLVEVPAAASAA
jgi:hypothetical protein